MNDPGRLHIAMAKLASALGVELDPKRPDHELLERLAERAGARSCTCPPGVRALGHLASCPTLPQVYVPRDPTHTPACTCPGCARAGNA